MIIVICGWCKKEFSTEGKTKKWGYPPRICPHCGRTVSASKKEPIESVVGRKHIHSDSKQGDIV